MYIINLYNVKWKKKYTQKEIAEATGLGLKTISQLFSGKHYNYELFTLETIAKFFNVSIDYLLNYEINYSDIDAFLNNLKDSYKNNKFNINTIHSVSLFISLLFG